MIDSYEFGRIVINGKRYDSDLIVFFDKVRSGWWRKEGHRLHVEDLKDVLEVKPEVLVVGTGYSGLMAVPSETRKYVESEGIELMARRRQKLVKPSTVSLSLEKLWQPST